jgi:RHS repeat-associated protein
MGLPRYWVNTANLMLVVADTDFAYAGMGVPLSFTRTYNSNPAIGGMFGNGWAFSYESSVTNTWEGALLSKAPGQLLLYKKTQLLPEGYEVPGPTTPPAGIYDALTLKEGNYWLLESRKKDRSQRYDFDAVAHRYPLTSITDANGQAVQFAYNPDGTLQTVTDAAGRITALAYDANKRCTAMTYPDGRMATFAYDGQGNLVRTTDRLGTVTTYEYDGQNYMTSFTVGDKVTRFTYNGENPKLIRTVQNALGQTTTYSRTASGVVTATAPQGAQSTYRHQGPWLLNAKDPLNADVYQYSYSGGLPVQSTDALGNTTSMSYDGQGNMVERQTDGLSEFYGYDSANDLRTFVNPKFELWGFQYDGRHNLTRATSPLGNFSQTTYSPAGQVLTRTNANGRTTSFTYDAFGNRTSVTDPLGGVTTFQYDPAGINRISRTDANSHTQSFTYDANRRLTKITNPDGTFKTYTYDCCALTGTTDENGNTTTVQRNSLLWPVAVTDALGKTTGYRYDLNGRLTGIADPRGYKTTFTYDGAGRPVATTDPLNGWLTKTYDANWNLTSLTDERGRRSQFLYDSKNKLIRVTDPLAKTVNYQRDPLGRVAGMTNARSQSVAYTYDGDGRLTRKAYGGTTVGDYYYDQMYNLTAFSDATGSTIYTRDGLERVTGIAFPDGTSASKTYDAVGNLLTLAYPGGLSVSYTYDSGNRVTNISAGGSLLTMTYDGVGNLLTETRANGTTTEYGYDSNDRVNSIRHQKGPQVLADLQYARDPAGNVVRESGTFPLDAAYSAGTVNGTYNGGNQLVNRGGDAYAYDNDGNLTTISGSRSWVVAYDHENRPTTMTRDGLTTNYAYNARGQRVKSTTGTLVRNYHYNEEGRLLYETDGTNQVTAWYLYREDRLVAMRTQSGAVYHYHFDVIGNTLAMTDAGGATIRAYRYSPFGEVVNQSGFLYNPFTYAGVSGVMDEGQGVYFMKHRYYDALTGRFLQKDPLGFRGGTNLYAYVNNNPVTFKDPKGLRGVAGGWSISEDGLVVPVVKENTGGGGRTWDAVCDLFKEKAVEQGIEKLLGWPREVFLEIFEAGQEENVRRVTDEFGDLENHSSGEIFTIRVDEEFGGGASWDSDSDE